MATNDYYNYTSGTFVKGQTARAETVESEFTSLETGLDKLPTEAEGNRGTRNYAVDTGSTDNQYVVTLAHITGSYQDGQEVLFLTSRANTGACTLNVSGIANTSITLNDGATLPSGAISANSLVRVSLNTTTNTWQLMASMNITNTVSAFVATLLDDPDAATFLATLGIALTGAADIDQMLLDVAANNLKVTNATHTGDVTGATALTIASDAVTYAKMQNVVADQRILGNIGGAGGIVSELTAAQVLTLIGVDADIKTLALPANTTISTFGASLIDDADAAAGQSTLGVPPNGRTISTTAPLAGGGSLAGDRTLTISAATTSAAGSMSAADKAKSDKIGTGALVYTTSTSIATSSPTNINWNAEDYDDDSIHDLSTNPERLTVPSGVTEIKISFSIKFEPNATGYRSGYLSKNGSLTFKGAIGSDRLPVNSTASSVVFGKTAKLNVVAGDYFMVQAYQDSGSSLNISYSTTWFAMEIIK